MRVLISTDLEGISGVCVWEQSREMQSALYRDACALLMADISAAVDGCLAGGATEVIVTDGHGGGFNFVPSLMHPKAKFFTGRNRRPFLCWSDMLQDMDACILLGYHAMAGTPDGMLRHTQSSRGGNRYWYNGRESGELLQSAVMYGHFGMPVVMVTGDSATIREAHDFFGDDVVGVSVKTGYGAEFGLMLSPDEAHERIREGACEAMARIDRCRPYVLATPIEGRLQFPDKSVADGFQPRLSHRVDDYAFEATFDSPLDIYLF